MNSRPEVNIVNAHMQRPREVDQRDLPVQAKSNNVKGSNRVGSVMNAILLNRAKTDRRALLHRCETRG